MQTSVNMLIFIHTKTRITRLNYWNKCLLFTRLCNKTLSKKRMMRTGGTQTHDQWVIYLFVNSQAGRKCFTEGILVVSSWMQTLSSSKIKVNLHSLKVECSRRRPVVIVRRSQPDTGSSNPLTRPGFHCFAPQAQGRARSCRLTALPFGVSKCVTEGRTRRNGPSVEGNSWPCLTTSWVHLHQCFHFVPCRRLQWPNRADQWQFVANRGLRLLAVTLQRWQFFRSSRPRDVVSHSWANEPCVMEPTDVGWEENYLSKTRVERCCQ